MGLRPDLLEFIERCARDTIGELRGARMLELGNQRVHRPGVPRVTGKQYYRDLGVDHTSFDLNGQDGALAVDLGRPCGDARWKGAFDIVTNAGTTEHVEPLEAQYEVFRNVHDWLRPGGVAVHMVPFIDALEREGMWVDHCSNYFTFGFFERLAEVNGYTVVNPEEIWGMVCVGLQKNGAAPFASDRRELLEGIVRRPGGRVYSGINDGSTVKRIARRIGVYTRKAVEALKGAD